MELDFDKEIDALLRREAAGRTITISEYRDGIHLDADEIAAFAEKSVPTGVRQTFVSHFAECDRCRKILLNIARLNIEEATVVEGGVAAPVVPAVPWYRRLFLFPNLAYVMGGLVLLFAGFIGVSMLSTMYRSGQSDVSSVGSSKPEQRPAAASESAANTNASASFNSTANAANTASNSIANAPGEGQISVAEAASNTALPRFTPASGPTDKERADDDDRSVPPPAPPPPPAKDEAYTADRAETRQSQPLPAATPAPERDKRQDSSKLMGGADPGTRNSSPAQPKMQGPARSEQRDRNLALEEKSRVARKTAPAAASPSASQGPGRNVGGRTYTFRQGVWYDTGYQGQATINVRRDSKEFQKLDGGLRGLAQSFIGTVVVTVWNGRAYRIQ